MPGAASNVRQKLPSRVQLEFQSLASSVRGRSTAYDLWETLTPAEHKRLGDNLEAAYAARQGTAGMWMALHGGTHQRAVVEIALKLDLIEPARAQRLLRQMGEQTDDPVLDKDAAIAAGLLVVDEQCREVFWKQVLIPIDWRRRNAPWAFLSELCRAAKVGKAVDRLTLGPQFSKDYVSRQKHRLTKLPGFPKDLAALIEAGGPGSKKLDLPPEKIRVFELAAADAQEWSPRRAT